MSASLPTFEPSPLPESPGVLVAEGDAVLCQCLANVLRRRGYQVWTAGNGIAALEIIRENRGRIRMVLADVGMPRLDGVTLLKRLQSEAPDIACRLMTSGRRSEALAALPDTEQARIIVKPFSAQDLADQVAQEVAPRAVSS
ncbi:MAG: response regulator [Gemmataceae bacterium]